MNINIRKLNESKAVASFQISDTIHKEREKKKQNRKHSVGQADLRFLGAVVY